MEVTCFNRLFCFAVHSPPCPLLAANSSQTAGASPSNITYIASSYNFYLVASVAAFQSLALQQILKRLYHSSTSPDDFFLMLICILAWV